MSLEEWCLDPYVSPWFPDPSERVWDYGTCYVGEGQAETWGTLIIGARERLVIEGTLYANTLHNLGSIEVLGAMSNSETITIETDGSLLNLGEFWNSKVVYGPTGEVGCINGEVRSYGTILNMGKFYNADATRGFSSGSDITNYEEATFYNYSWLRTSNTSSSFINLGIFYNSSCRGSNVSDTI